MLAVNDEDQHPLINLYGSDAFDLVLEEIRKLQVKSNFPFDNEYVQLGVSFAVIKATQIVEGKKPTQNLQSLVSECFGEAAIYKYNILKS